MNGAQIWPGLALSLSMLAILLVVRRLLSEDQRRRSMAATVLLVLAAVMRLGSAIAESNSDLRFGDAIDFLHLLFLGLGVAAFADILIFDFGLTRLGLHVPRILRDILQAAAFLIILMTLFSMRGVDVLPLVTTSAVLTAVIGLALQSTLSNLFAGLALQLDRSFVIGEWITVGQKTGRITQIKWRSTSIQTRDGDMLIVPNIQLTTNDVINLSQPTRAHRVFLTVHVDYDYPPNDVKRIFLSAVRGAPGVLDTPAPNCVPAAFGDVAIQYLVTYWIDDQSRDLSIDGEVRTRLWYGAKREGIDLRPAQHSVLLRQDPHLHLDRQRADLAERLALLERIDVLVPLDDSDRLSLAGQMKHVRFAQGERIIGQGDPGDSLFLVESGQVSVVLGREGGEREVATLGPRDFFGEMSLITGEPRNATCSAKSDVTAFLIDHASFKELLESKPKLAEDISLILGSRMHALFEGQEELSAEARAKTSAESSKKALSRIKAFFNLR